MQVQWEQCRSEFYLAPNLAKSNKSPECLQKGGKGTSVVQSHLLHLFTKILNQYFQFHRLATRDSHTGLCWLIMVAYSVLLASGHDKSVQGPSFCFSGWNEMLASAGMFYVHLHPVPTHCYRLWEWMDAAVLEKIKKHMHSCRVWKTQMYFCFFMYHIC